MFQFASPFARVLAVDTRPAQARIDRFDKIKVTSRKHGVEKRVADSQRRNEGRGGWSLDRRLLIGMGICAQVLPAKAEIGNEIGDELKVNDQDPTAKYRYFTTDQIDEVGDRRVFLEVERSRRIQKLNSSPPGFPIFVRIGYNVDIVFEPSDPIDVRDDGTILVDFRQGSGPYPADRQEIEFHYTAYNEQGKVVDSTYRQGRPATAKLGTSTTLIPGFQTGIRSMKVGGRRRIIVPPELGPPVGPSTFFSSRQFEVFDVELLQIRKCIERQNLMVKKLECTEVIA